MRRWQMEAERHLSLEKEIERLKTDKQKLVAFLKGFLEDMVLDTPEAVRETEELLRKLGELK